MGHFIIDNIALVAVFIASGAFLVWPEIQKLVGGASEVNTLDATRLINQPTTLILDVRDGAEYGAGHLPRARHIPLGELSKRIDEIGKYRGKPVLVACASGARSGSAARLLKQAGFTTVYHLKGGLAAWREASLPLEK